VESTYTSKQKTSPQAGVDYPRNYAEFMRKANGIQHYLIMDLEIVLLSITVWLTFLIAPWVAQRLGKIGINVFTRLMGLILAAIAVEFIASGMRGLFPALG